MSIVAKYVGKNGEFLGGIPARNLEPGDWARLSEAQRALVTASAIYDMVVPEKPAKKKAEDKK